MLVWRLGDDQEWIGNNATTRPSGDSGSSEDPSLIV